MRDDNVDKLGGIGEAFLVAANIAVVLAVVVALVYGVLVVMAALGLTSFSALEFFRKKDRREREDAPDGGIDDLF